MERGSRCFSCPHFQRLKDETTDFAERVRRADESAERVLSNHAGVANRLATTIGTLEQSGVECSLDDELRVLTSDADEIPDLRCELTAMESALLDSFSRMKAIRHDKLDARIAWLAQLSTLCDELGSCSLEPTTDTDIADWPQ
ncbi:hypothetical protein CR983_02115 [Candidatus Saccharibacteria bacterium]|nr:MAG: hypothetical protein CR983_02115 [Candidatus Saccharibacteria bacterium]